MTKEQVLMEYGEELSQTAKTKLDEIEGKSSSSNYYIQTSREIHSVYSDTIAKQTTGILGGMEAVPMYPWTEGFESSSTKPLIEVYECE
jgi:hypothetical protein